jgi:hypothetical protein
MDLLKLRPVQSTAAALLLTALSAIGCGGGSSSVSDIQNQPRPRPAYGSLNLSMGSTQSGTAPTTRQLFLDPGSTQYPKSWPQLVANHPDNQPLVLWRYDFIEPGVSDGTQWYATLLLRVDDEASASTLSFYGRGGAYPANPVNLNPKTAFSGDVPETPANKKPISCFLFVRQGVPVNLVNPQIVGKVAPYRSFSDKATCAINVPGLDFPVGGATLTAGADTSVVGIADAVTDMGGSTSGGTGGTSQSGITTPVQTVNAERVPTTTLVSPVTSQFDLLYAWQAPQFGVTLTHAVYADPSTAGGDYTTGLMGTSGGGFFLTMRPGSPDPSNGVNTLNWTILRTQTDAVWTLGWSSDLTATTSITRGQSQDVLTTKAAGSAVVSAQVRGYLSGLMAPDSLATMFMGAQDQSVNGGPAVLLEASHLPLVARQPNATIAAHMGQLVVAGRSLWYRQNTTVQGADVLNSDQSLTDPYGTVLSFSAYLPTR